MNMNLRQALTSLILFCFVFALLVSSSPIRSFKRGDLEAREDYSPSQRTDPNSGTFGSPGESTLPAHGQVKREPKGGAGGKGGGGGGGGRGRGQSLGLSRGGGAKSKSGSKGLSKGLKSKTKLFFKHFDWEDLLLKLQDEEK